MHGMTMDVAAGQGADLFIKSTGSIIAHLAINKTVPKRPNYTLVWTVRHAGGLVCPHTSGVIELSAAAMKKVFCLDDKMNDPDSLWLIERYGGTVAAQGEFFRCGSYLNIPHPGTGYQGDPNLSILLDYSIRLAVMQLLSKVPAVAG